MHELPVTESILEIVERHATAAGATRVTRIRLVVGDFTGFVPDSIQFYFDILSKGTVAEGARLEIDRLPGRVRCRGCGHVYPPIDGQMWICPKCGAPGGEAVAGKEMYIESIEVLEESDGNQGRREDSERE